MPGFRIGAQALALAPFLLACAAAPAGTADDLRVKVAVEGAEIVARGRDGAALAPEAVVGATFALGDPASGAYLIRIDGVMPRSRRAGIARLVRPFGPPADKRALAKAV